MTINELMTKNEQLEKDILYFKRRYEDKLHELSNWIELASNHQKLIDVLGSNLAKNDGSTINDLRANQDKEVENLRELLKESGRRIEDFIDLNMMKPKTF